MSTAEILSGLTAQTVKYQSNTSQSETSWQDILLAMQGLEPGKTGFMLYVYGGHDHRHEHHNFYAGLLMEVLQRPEILLWREHRKQQPGYNRNIERMVLMTIIEWREASAIKCTAQHRAQCMGVSLSTWKRKYKQVYQTIMAIPAYWEDEVMRMVNKRLR